MVSRTQRLMVTADDDDFRDAPPTGDGVLGGREAYQGAGDNEAFRMDEGPMPEPLHPGALVRPHACPARLSNALLADLAGSAPVPDGVHVWRAGAGHNGAAHHSRGQNGHYHAVHVGAPAAGPAYSGCA